MSYKGAISTGVGCKSQRPGRVHRVCSNHLSDSANGSEFGHAVQFARNCSQLVQFYLSLYTMDSFDNFQYDSASSYGGMGVVDDTSSVYTANTADNASSVDLSSLSISEYNSVTGNGHDLHQHSHSHPMRNGVDEDFDAVLDDLKDEGVVDLPPHACRYVLTPLCAKYLAQFQFQQLLWHPFSCICGQVSYMLEVVLQLAWKYFRFPHSQPSCARKA